MVLAAYVAGVLTPVAAILAGWAGHWWWLRTRRAQAESEELAITGARVLRSPPRPALPQDEAVVMGRARYGTNVPGKRRRLRGHRGDING